MERKNIPKLLDRNYLHYHNDIPLPGESGKLLLFDIGSSTYNTGPGGASTSEFVNMYNNLGLKFNSIFAWEARPINPIHYWHLVPSELRSKIHFFNIPAVSEVGHVDNPLTLITQLCQPQDYCVVKIDIDITQIELAWINQIEKYKLFFNY